MSEPTLREQVEKWLEGMGLGYEPVPADKAQYDWALTVTGQAFGAIVAKRAGGDKLWMQIQVRVADSHLEVLQRLDERARQLFLIDLRLALHRTPAAHWFQRDEEPLKEGQIPNVVGIGINILESPMELPGFMRRNFQLQAAAGVVALTFQRLFVNETWP